MREATPSRLGQLILSGVLLALLLGHFTLDRLGSMLPSVDLRWPALYLILVLYLPWTLSWQRRSESARARVGVFVLWAAWLALSALWAPPAARVHEYLTDQFFLVTFVALGATTARRLSSADLTVIWKLLVVTGLLYLVDAPIVGPDLQGRYSAFGGGPNVFVRVMVFAALGTLYLAVSKQRVRLLLLLPAFFAGAVMSGSRGGLISFAVVITVAAAPLLRRLPKRVLGFTLLSVAALVMIAPAVSASVVGETFQQRIVRQTLQQRYDSGRSEILVQAWGLFSQHPFRGVGLDGYYGEIGHIVGYQHPHNLLSASAAEGGLIGLGLLMAALAALIGSSRRHRPMTSETLFLLLGGISVLVEAMFSGNYYDSRLMWFFLALSSIEGQRHHLSHTDYHTTDRLPLGEWRPDKAHA